MRIETARHGERIIVELGQSVFQFVEVMRGAGLPQYLSSKERHWGDAKEALRTAIALSPFNPENR